MQDLLIEVPLRRAVLARQAELALQRGSSAGRVADGLQRGVPLAWLGLGYGLGLGLGYGLGLGSVIGLGLGLGYRA